MANLEVIRTYFLPRNSGAQAKATLDGPRTPARDAVVKCCWNRPEQMCEATDECDGGGEGCVENGAHTREHGEVRCFERAELSVALQRLRRVVLNDKVNVDLARAIMVFAKKSSMVDSKHALAEQQEEVARLVKSRSNRSVSSRPFVHIIQSAVDLTTRNISRKRSQEYISTLKSNLEHPSVKGVHLIWEHDVDMGAYALHSTSTAEWLQRYGNKIVHARKNNGRMRFFDAISYANTELAGEVVLLTNSDIHLGAGFAADALNRVTLPVNTVLIPIRKEAECTLDSNTLKPKHGSKPCDCRVQPLGVLKGAWNCFDSYMFRAPLPVGAQDERHFSMLTGGQWGAENVFVAELRNIGVNVYSPPCGLFELIHNHCSQERPNQRANILDPRAWQLPFEHNRNYKDGHGPRPWASPFEPCYKDPCWLSCQYTTFPVSDSITEWCMMCDDVIDEQSMPKLSCVDETPAPPAIWGPVRHRVCAAHYNQTSACCGEHIAKKVPASLQCNATHPVCKGYTRGAHYGKCEPMPVRFSALGKGSCCHSAEGCNVTQMAQEVLYGTRLFCQVRHRALG